VSAEVDDFVTGASQFLDHALVERVPTMICANCNLHEY
jgi:hypothetical protein